MENIPKCIAIVGIEGSGKSTLSINIAKNIDKKILIIEPDKFGETFQDLEIISNIKVVKRKRKKVSRIIYYKGIFEDIMLNIRNYTIIFDDFRMIKEYLDRLPNEIKTIIARRRHMNNDIILSLHGFNDVPARMYQHISHFIIFKTRDYPYNAKKYLSEIKYNKILMGIYRANNSPEFHYNEFIS